MGPHRVAGLVPVAKGDESGTAAYESASLHPRIAPVARYSFPAKPYRYNGPRPVESLVSRNRQNHRTGVDGRVARGSVTGVNPIGESGQC